MSISGLNVLTGFKWMDSGLSTSQTGADLDLISSVHVGSVLGVGLFNCKWTWA